MLKGDHIISFIVHPLKLEFNSNPGLQKDPVLTLSDEDLLATVQEGILLGWSQVPENIDSLQRFLTTPIPKRAEPEEHTLAYIDTSLHPTVSKINHSRAPPLGEIKMAPNQGEGNRILFEDTTDLKSSLNRDEDEMGDEKMYVAANTAKIDIVTPF